MGDNDTMSINEWNVLVVEDERDSMELVQEVLGHYGIQSTGAESAETALDILQSMVPTLIIIDLNLPRLDGWGLLKRIQQNHVLLKVPCVAITAYHTAELAEKALTAGFNAYFPKPLDATSFVRELEGIVAN
jgi:CheY-like chemotaxis protein